MGEGSFGGGLGDPFGDDGRVGAVVELRAVAGELAGGVGDGLFGGADRALVVRR